MLQRRIKGNVCKCCEQLFVFGGLKYRMRHLSFEVLSGKWLLPKVETPSAHLLDARARDAETIPAGCSVLVVYHQIRVQEFLAMPEAPSKATPDHAIYLSG